MCTERTGTREGKREMRRSGQQDMEPGLTMTLQAPEIQTMYSLNMPVSTLRTKMRQEFERHRYVNQLKTVDVLLFNSHQEFQVHHGPTRFDSGKYTDNRTGNTQLLETIVTRSQILPRGRGSQGPATKQLHQRLLGGTLTLCVINLAESYANAHV